MFELISRKMLVLVLAFVVMMKTNPTLEQHRKVLYPDVFILTGLRVEPLARQFFPKDATSAEVVGRPLPEIEPSIEWHDYKIFSTATTGGLFGIRQSFGILGHVFDLRTDAERTAQEEQVQRANRQELAKIVESMGKPWFRSVPKVQIGDDYSSRGCAPEGDDKR
jgi:hypothetical protein